MDANLEYNLSCLPDSFWAKVECVGECWNWTVIGTDRPVMPTMVNGIKKSPKLHVWEAINGPLAKGSYVQASCMNERCVNPRHLTRGSRQALDAHKKSSEVRSRGEKTCSACGIQRPLTDYHANTRTGSGTVSKCKQCCAIEHHYYYVDNRERHLRICASWRLLNKEKISAALKIWRERNTDRVRQHRTKWALANPEKVARQRQSYGKRQAGKLSNKYIKSLVSARLKIPYSDLKYAPSDMLNDLTASIKEEVRIKRLAKSKKHLTQTTTAKP